MSLALGGGADGAIPYDCSTCKGRKGKITIGLAYGSYPGHLFVQIVSEDIRGD